MKILAIETSCDETAIALLDAKQKGAKTHFTILGNDLSSQIALHTQYGGVFPMMAKREHQKNIIPILISVLKQANMHHHLALSGTPPQQGGEEFGPLLIEEGVGGGDPKITKILEREQELLEQWNKIIPFIAKPKIDAIVVTVGPGLEPALWVGINFAQALGAYWDIPVVGVNHMEGHIFSIFPKALETFTVEHPEKMFPMLSLLVSGGHTELVLVKDWMKYKRIGQTRDDAAGEAFDKVARMLGLPYPGGPEISRLAQSERSELAPLLSEEGVGGGDPNSKINPKPPPRLSGTPPPKGGEEMHPHFPRPMIHSKDYDFSFSGLKTAVLYYIRDHGPLTEDMKSHIAKEFEDAAIEVLVSKTLRAVQQYKIKTLIIGGGVSANKYLKEQLTTHLQEKAPHVTTHFPAKGLSTDNALMIAIAGYFQFQKKKPRRQVKLKAVGNLSL
jgi:N6-L-threonylcarbamoyladenine synthase